MARIRTITLEHFRGVPGHITVDLCRPRSREALSVIILGDNGTGKSSIVDAIEFALQGTYRRTRRLASPNLPSLLSLHAPATEATIRIDLDDDTHVVTNIVTDDFGKPHADMDCHPSFRLAPIALRRRDILSFLETPEEQRQVAFLDLFRYGDGGRRPPDSEEVRALKERQLETKNRRRSAIRQIAERRGVSTEVLPSTSPQITEFLRQHVYQGKTKWQRRAMERTGQLRLDSELVALTKEIDLLGEELKSIARLINNATKSQQHPRHDVRNKLAEFFRAAGHVLSDWFLEISTAADFVTGVTLVPGEISDMSLAVTLTLSNGQTCTPHNVLSEANLDLLALLLFLAVAKEASNRGQAPLLMLDDVLQSVDASIRVSFAEFLLREFADWQLIITVHDRLWHSQLREMFRRAGHQFVEQVLSRWRFDAGFTLLEPDLDLDTRLRAAIDSSDVHGICGMSGLLLELLCDRLSVLLEVSVIRRREDKYTLADLWPGIMKRIKKTTGKECAADVDKWIHLRNLVGAHFNEWAQALSVSEAEQFGLATLTLYSMVRCQQCHTWIEATGRAMWQCRCGKTTISKA